MASLVPLSLGQSSPRDLLRFEGKAHKPSPTPQWEKAHGDIKRARGMKEIVEATFAK